MSITAANIDAWVLFLECRRHNVDIPYIYRILHSLGPQSAGKSLMTKCPEEWLRALIVDAWEPLIEICNDYGVHFGDHRCWPKCSEFEEHGITGFTFCSRCGSLQ
jgi:hypothetical protein